MVSYTLVYAFIIIGNALVFGNVYSSLVDAPNWGFDIPNSIAAARAYFKHKNPGSFFKIFGPASLGIGLLSIIVCWQPFPASRWYLIFSFLMFAVLELFTVIYFFPRNDIMFEKDPLTDRKSLHKTWSEWNRTNWIRSLISLAGVVAACLALNAMYGR